MNGKLVVFIVAHKVKNPNSPEANPSSLFTRVTEDRTQD